jgi:hypothetical protein
LASCYIQQSTDRHASGMQALLVNDGKKSHQRNKADGRRTCFMATSLYMLPAACGTVLRSSSPE